MTKHTKKSRKGTFQSPQNCSTIFWLWLFLSTVVLIVTMSCFIYVIFVNFSVPKIVSRLYDRIKYINVFALYKRIPRNSTKIRGLIKSKIFGTVAYKFPKKSGSVCHYFTPPQASWTYHILSFLHAVICIYGSLSHVLELLKVISLGSLNYLLFPLCILYRILL